MGVPTCHMQQQPFSYAAGIPNEANQGNPLHALGQSISFGKFMSESLAWDKWSNFSHNRYVEEAERFSRPGSVAQKKAFFEAHYKNLAARKAAALLGQANTAANNVPEPTQEGEVQENATQDPGIAINTEASFVPDDNGHNSHVQMEKSEGRKVEEIDPVRENQAFIGKFVKVESLSQPDVSDNEEEMKETELSRTKLMEKPLLKDFISDRDDLGSTNKNKSAVYSSKSLISGRASNLPCSPAKPAASVRARKENNVTPISKKSAIGFIDKKKSTPKSTYKSMNFTPVRELNRITSTIIRKIDGSKVTSNSKALKDCPTPLRTPTTVSVLREPKHPLATPLSESRRAKTPLQPSASGSKAVRPKWHFLPTDCSKFMSPSRNKSRSPNLCTPFSLRTEERATRRKERLEEKFNANQAQKVQLHATLKEKAETELKRLRQTLCFKARPLPEFYRERATPKNQVEKSAKQGRTSTPNPSMVQSNSQPPHRSAFKNGNSKHSMGKKIENSPSLTSRLRSITRGNTSKYSAFLDDEKLTSAW
ncbi:LOW QUALITY PROTEIN: protein WVD2-like 7 [Hevea brasiliensis]|uniref:LOW QUALITY PROTEIN: protein WVD2-like 7 n=1 Tax=Hevea brasiliensis TaxID=3981 RepID=UPI0025CFD195|nr:LOW QUALITY PROTEIN: protein WVD2-like 7 [Hevea brasiliensis]